MIIKKLTATFGRLSGDSLELKPGLNIIKAPNESGKSTWCAFIKAMLYGINTSERDKAGYMSDKNKYSPWSGTPMSGEMELLSGGKDITISRSAMGAAPFRRFSAVYTGTAEPVPGLDGSSAGETLTGATEKVYERTAFIRQTGMRISQNSDLEKRIAALVSSGSEARSFSEADSDIKSWLRKYKLNKSSGSIPKLEAERAELEDRCRALEDSTERVSRLRQSLSRALETKRRLSGDLEIYEKIEKRNMLRSLSEARDTARLSSRKIEELENAISVSGHIPTKDEINEIRAKCSTLDSLNILYMRSLDTAETAKAALAEAEENYASNDFRGRFSSDDEAFSAASFLSGYTVPEPEPEPVRPLPKTYSGQIAAFIAAALAGALFGILGFTALPSLRDLAPAGFGVTALGAVLALIFLGRRVKEKAAYDAYVPPVKADPLEKYYPIFPNMDFPSIKSEAAEFLTVREAFLSARSAQESANAGFIDAGRSVKAAENLVLSLSKHVAPGFTDPYSILPRLAVIERAIDELTKLKLEKMSSESLVETLGKTVSDDLGVTENELLPVPMYSKELTAEKLKEADSEYESLSREYNIAYGALRAAGDPAVLKSRISKIDELLAGQYETYECLTLAATALQEANAELQTRFSPVISRKAGQYMSVLTGGRYSDIVFDKAFNAMAKSDGESVSRSILALSEGTADQIYLALRLAMSSLILGGSEPPPIILDDAFVNFDNVRLAHAVRLLRKMSADRQIILFTCHNREIEAASTYPGVNIIVFPDNQAGGDAPAEPDLR